MAEQKKTVEATVRCTPALAAGASVRRTIRKKFTAEEKLRIVLEESRGESTIAELCRREEIRPNLYNQWRKEFLKAGNQV